MPEWWGKINKAFNKAISHIHKKGGYTSEMLVDKPVKGLINATKSILTSAINLSITDNQVPERMKESLLKDIFVFSGCRTEALLKEASSLLLDKDRKIKPFPKFKADVTATHTNYNQHYLKAEYHFATSSAQMAAKWAEFEKDGDRYDLQYRTASDDKVRENHEKLHNITLPINDPFWDLYFPPNGWRCRCTVTQVRKGKYPISDSAEAMKKGETATTQHDKNGGNRLEMFRFNPGKQGVVFPKHHPYYKYKEAVNKHINEKGSISEAEKAALEKAAYRQSVYELPREKQFEKVKSYDNGGEIRKHLLVDMNKSDYPEVLATAQFFAKKGRKVEILPEIHAKETDVRTVLLPDYDKHPKNPDLKVGNIYWEVEKTEIYDNIAGRISKGSKQANRVLLVFEGDVKGDFSSRVNFLLKQIPSLEEVIVKSGSAYKSYKRSME